MAIILKNKHKTLFVKMIGDLDLVSAREFRDSVDQAMLDLECQHIILELSRTSFIDSSGIGVILGRFRKLKERNSIMILCGLTPNVLRILELAGILQLFAVCTNESEAWKIIEKKSLKEA